MMSKKLSFKRNVYKGKNLRTEGEIYDQKFELKPERIQILLVEYEQIQEKKLTYLKLLFESVVLYLTITGVVAGFALREEGITTNLIMAALFDIAIGVFGAVVLFTAKREWKDSRKRLKEICSLLDMEYESSDIINLSVWIILICYLFVVAGWLVTFVLRL